MNNKIRKIAIVVLAFIVIVIGSTVSISYANKVKAREVVQLGNKYLSEGKYTEAIIEFEKAIKIDKRNVDGYLGAATAYVNIENIEKAEEVLNLAINNVPKESEIYIELSDIYFNENKIEESVEVLDKGYDKTKDEQIKDKLNLIAEQLEIVVEDNFLLTETVSKVMLIKRLDDGTIIPINANWISSNEEIAKFLDKTVENIALVNEGKEKVNIGYEEETEVIEDIWDILKENNKYSIINGIKAGTVTIISQLGSIEKKIDINIEELIIDKIILKTRETVEQGNNAFIPIAIRVGGEFQYDLLNENVDNYNLKPKNIANYDGNEYYVDFTANISVDTYINLYLSEGKTEYEYEIFLLDKNNNRINKSVEVKIEGGVDLIEKNENKIKISRKSYEDNTLIISVDNISSSLNYIYTIKHHDRYFNQ